MLIAFRDTARTMIDTCGAILTTGKALPPGLGSDEDEDFDEEGNPDSDLVDYRRPYVEFRLAGGRCRVFFDSDVHMEVFCGLYVDAETEGKRVLDFGLVGLPMSVHIYDSQTEVRGTVGIEDPVEVEVSEPLPVEVSSAEVIEVRIANDEDDPVPMRRVQK